MHAPLASLTFASLAAAALPQGVIELPLQRIKNQSAYGAEFLVGNPPQKAIISADTGSPTYAFESPSPSTLRSLDSCLFKDDIANDHFVNREFFMPARTLLGIWHLRQHIFFHDQVVKR